MIRLKIFSVILALLVFPILLMAALPAQAAGNPQNGQKKFQLCASCHQIGPQARSGFGPALTGVVGRRAAGLPDFAYSEALKRSGIVWTEERLKAFLRDPDKLVPGTKMRFWGISDEQQLADLLAYLASIR